MSNLQYYEEGITGKRDFRYSKRFSQSNNLDNLSNDSYGVIGSTLLVR